VPIEGIVDRDASKGFKNMLQEYYAKLGKSNPSYVTIKNDQGLFLSTVSVQVNSDKGNVKLYTGLPFATKKASEQNAAEKAFKDKSGNLNTSNIRFFPSINDPILFVQITSTLNPIGRSSDNLPSIMEEPINQKNISKDVPSNPSITSTSTFISEDFFQSPILLRPIMVRQN
jgi:hypothetical protein